MKKTVGKWIAVALSKEYFIAQELKKTHGTVQPKLSTFTPIPKHMLKPPPMEWILKWLNFG